MYDFERLRLHVVDVEEVTTKVQMGILLVRVSRHSPVPPYLTLTLDVHSLRQLHYI